MTSIVRESPSLLFLDFAVRDKDHDDLATTNATSLSYGDGSGMNDPIMRRFDMAMIQLIL